MKQIHFKISLIALLTVVLVAMACKKDKTEGDTPSDGKDRITFTWQAEAESEKCVNIYVTEGKTFTVNWGDSSPIETKIGEEDNSITLKHTYTITEDYTVIITAQKRDCRFTSFVCVREQVQNLDASNCSALSSLFCNHNQLTSLDLSNCSDLSSLRCDNNQLKKIDLSGCSSLSYAACGENQLTSLNVSDCVALEYFECYTNQLTNLDLKVCSTLEYLFCNNNQLQLSDLYAAQLIVKINKEFGTQNLPLQTASIGQTLFSDQAVFDGTFTEYNVILKDNDWYVPESDYTVTDGKLTFNDVGNYTVKMTNEAIVSSWHSPAQVNVEITVTP